MNSCIIISTLLKEYGGRIQYTVKAYVQFQFCHLLVCWNSDSPNAKTKRL